MGDMTDEPTNGAVAGAQFVQLPHPGGEHGVPASGLRPWKLGDAAHRRTFLESPGLYRRSADGPDRQGTVAFWGEWEGAVRRVRELEHVERGPRWLCRPDPAGPAPKSADAPPQNTDPYVWGDSIRYTFCRQPTNQKLRGLGRGSVILFGSGQKVGFVLDTVLVVADWIDHRRKADLVGKTDEQHLRATIGPMYGWGEKGLTYRLYRGSTPKNHVDGMFSFVPCQPAESASGFARPIISLEDHINPNCRMQARVLDVGKADLPKLWRKVVSQVTGAGLALATRLDLPHG